MNPVKYKAITTSSVAKVTPLIPKENTTPRVLYSILAWNKIKYLVNKAQKEVGWFGLVEREENDYLITDIILPKQTVSSSETEILPEALAEAAMEIEEPEKLLYWGHSHVNMVPNPSAQDEIQINEYLEHVDFFIRGIYNKKGQSKVDVYDMENLVAYECVNNYPLLPQLTEEQVNELDQLFSANVKEKEYPKPNSSWGGPSYMHNPRYHRGNRIQRRSKYNPFILEE